MSLRKLATVRKISKLYPIPKRDRIDLAAIDGWNVIVKKDEFQANDLCVYFEIDSFLPDDPKYSFLGTPKLLDGSSGHRIKTMKLSGAVSQGLALPLHMFDISTSEAEEHFENGDDISSQLNVRKYERPDKQQLDNQSGSAKPSKFPSFLRKTDQERIQNLTNYFERYKDMEFEETKKLDGSSCTMYKTKHVPRWWEKALDWLGIKEVKQYDFGVCSRNLDLKQSGLTDKKSDFWKAAIKYKVEEQLPVGFAIQGELIGPSIQNNHEKVKELEFHIFNIWDIERQCYLTPIERHAVLECYNASHVPIVNKAIKIFQECTDVKALLARVEDVSMNPGTVSEGRVYKSLTNPNITFKVISNKYLIKSEK